MEGVGFELSVPRRSGHSPEAASCCPNHRPPPRNFGLFGIVKIPKNRRQRHRIVVAGFIVQGNFSNLTSGVLAVAVPRYLGATIGLYSCIGFGAGFLGTLLFGVTLDQLGGTLQVTAWIVSFGTCGLACLIGSAATMLLSRDLWRRW